MRQRLGLVAVALIANGLMAGVVTAQKPPLLAEKDVAALANELSGETAKRNLEVIATFHRQRGSRGFHAAAELVAERAREYGLSDVAILEFPADGKIFYGTQRSRPAWDAEVGELWERNVALERCDEAKIQMEVDKQLLANSEVDIERKASSRSKKAFEDCRQMVELGVAIGKLSGRAGGTGGGQ